MSFLYLLPSVQIMNWQKYEMHVLKKLILCSTLEAKCLAPSSDRVLPAVLTHAYFLCTLFKRLQNIRETSFEQMSHSTNKLNLYLLEWASYNTIFE